MSRSRFLRHLGPGLASALVAVVGQFLGAHLERGGVVKRDLKRSLYAVGKMKPFRI
jgi:hypothetical protein